MLQLVRGVNYPHGYLGFCATQKQFMGYPRVLGGKLLSSPNTTFPDAFFTWKFKMAA